MSWITWHHFGSDCDTRIASIRFYHWNVWRYTADAAHILALLICLAALLRDRRTLGVSLKTQLLYLLVFTTRYPNVFFCKQWFYLLFLKGAFWAGTALIVVLLLSGGAASDGRDTCSMRLLLGLSTVLALCASEYQSVAEVLCVFSQYLESFSMLPQYIYCYRDGRVGARRSRGCIAVYVLLLGGYRMLYGLNFLQKSFYTYVPPSSWASAVLNVAFFVDFLAFRLGLRGSAPVRKAGVAGNSGRMRPRRARIWTSMGAVGASRCGGAIFRSPERIGRWAESAWDREVC